MRSIVRLSISVLFISTLAGSALARQPPALVRSQEAANQALARCVGDALAPGSGYRDVYGRSHAQRAWQSVGSPPQTAPAVPPVQNPGRQKVVLVCPSGLVHLAAGYRDVYARFRAESPPMIVAGDPSRLLRGQTWFW